MGIELNYRTSTHKKEILDSLMEIQVEASPVLIWQNENGNRKITKAKIESIDFKNDSIVLTPFAENDTLSFMSFETKQTVYLRGNSKSIVFKQDKVAQKNSNGSLQIFIPDEVKMFEKRGVPRLSFSESFFKVTTQIYPGNIVDRKTKSLTAELRDVSAMGLGFFIEKKYARLFFEKDKIKIERIGNYKFPRAIYGEIVYVNFGSNFDNVVRVGVRFDQEIDKDILTKIN